MNHEPEDPKKSSDLWTESDKHDLFLENTMTVILAAAVAGILIAVLLT